MADQLCLSFLGGMQITRGGEPITGFISAKAQALLSYLAVTGQPHLRPALAALLWGDRPEANALASLRQALRNLRRPVGPYLTVTRQVVAFNREQPYWLDVEAFQAAWQRMWTGRGDPKPPFGSAEWESLRQAAELYRGDFLAGFQVRDAPAFEEWMLLQRERLHRQAYRVLQALAAHHEARLEYPAAIEYTTRLLALDPWREEAHRHLMLLLARSGQRSAALAQYEKCRRILAKELGVEPMAETTALYERIRAARLVRGHNLPPQFTPFIGREEELAALARLLANAECRLITVTGPGGIGKTRLALQAAARYSEIFLHGVYFVPLAGIDSVDSLVSAIAEVLGFSFYGQQDPQAQLLNYLRDKELLLVLDNFEHLLDGAGLLVEILHHTPEVRILTTSRERLNLRCEWLLELEGLECPRDDKAGEPEGFSAIELFLQSARRVDWRFSLPEEEKPAMVRICRLLEGMPLGIEMAAAWVRDFSCDEIAGEIEHNLDFLNTFPWDVPERQRSLRAVFEHSWRLLSKEEQGVFKRLSVFRGDFQQEAAHYVAGASRPVLSSLADKSLLRRTSSGRREMHDFLRWYAEMKLDETPQEREETLHRHCRYFADFVNRREKALREGGRQGEALDEISREIENIRAAWRWAVEHGRLEEIAKTLGGLYFFYDMRSRFQEGKTIFSKATAQLEQTWNTSPSSEREEVLGRLLAREGVFCHRLGLHATARELLQKSLSLFRRLGISEEIAFSTYHLSYVAWGTGEYVEAKRLLQESLALCRAAGNRWEMARALNNLGFIANEVGDYHEARQFLEESLAIEREIGDRWGMAKTLNNVGIGAANLGEYARAKQYYEESLVIRREMGDRRGMALVLNNLGNASFNLGEYGEARRFHLESLAIFREVGDRRGEAFSLNNLGNVALAQEEHEQARKHFRESMLIKEEIGDRKGVANSLNNLGRLTCALGDYREAGRCFREALRIAMEIHAIPKALEALVGIASLLAKEGKQERALELFTLAFNHPAIEDEIKSQVEGLFAELTSRLPRQAVAAAQEKGRARRLEEVLEEICSR